jgi:hypothetical protein
MSATSSSRPASPATPASPASPSGPASPASPARESAGWLDALEERVREAAERLRAVGAENDRLRGQLARLERELATARAAVPAAAVPAEPPAGGDGAETGRWPEERAEVRRRVERLAARLGELLASAGE